MHTVYAGCDLTWRWPTFWGIIDLNIFNMMQSDARFLCDSRTSWYRLVITADRSSSPTHICSLMLPQHEVTTTIDHALLSISRFSPELPHLPIMGRFPYRHSFSIRHSWHISRKTWNLFIFLSRPRNFFVPFTLPPVPSIHKILGLCRYGSLSQIGTEDIKSIYDVPGHSAHLRHPRNALL